MNIFRSVYLLLFVCSVCCGLNSCRIKSLINPKKNNKIDKSICKNLKQDPLIKWKQQVFASTITFKSKRIRDPFAPDPEPEPVDSAELKAIQAEKDSLTKLRKVLKAPNKMNLPILSDSTKTEPQKVAPNEKKKANRKSKKEQL
ncbi:MAG: hypothetical protein NZ108_06200 [Bacteroidia bacterium]|nr:hypothetical protein [Bacteroidia bacterium]